MGLLFAESFDSYSASSELLRNWGIANWPWNSTAGRLGGGAARTSSSQQSMMPRSPAGGNFNLSPSHASGSRIGSGYWLKVSAVPSAVFYINYFSTAATFLGGYQIFTSGVMRLSQSDGNIPAGGTGTTNVCDNAWHWIEHTWCYNSTASANTLWVDGLQQFSITYASGNAGSPIILSPLMQSSTNSIVIVDDPIWVDDQLPSPRVQDMPFGARLVSDLRPASDDSVQFSRSAGSDNYALVNETAGDGDTTYVQSGTTGHVDRYGYADLAYSPSTINAVQVVTRVMNPGAGTISFKNRCVSGATTSDSASQVAFPNYNNFRNVYNQDPNTSAAWTVANLNAAKFGLTVV